MTVTEQSRYVRKTVVLDRERDAALLVWLDAQANTSAAIRAALQAYSKASTITLEEVYRAVQDLTAMVCGGQWIPGSSASTAKSNEDPELAAQLDRLGL